MSYSEYYFCSRRETENRYQEYGGKIQKGEGNSYQEYGDPKMAGTDSVFNKNGGATPHVDLKAWDDKFENFLAKQEKIKAERIAKRTAYCDEKGIQGQLREDIIKGKIRIEDYEKIAEQARDVTEQTEVKPQPAILTEEFFHPTFQPSVEAPETPVEEPVAEQPVDTTAEPEEKPKKRSKKKSEEV